MSAINFIPLLISSLFLAIISFMKKTKKNKKAYWIITALIIWLGVLLWTLNVMEVIV